MPQLYHPDELGLERITADDDIIQRCGKLVILFVDPDIDDISPGETVSSNYYAGAILIVKIIAGFCLV